MIMRRTRPRMLMAMNFLAFLWLCAGYSRVSYAQQSPLPAPTGPYTVGRTLFEWTDESRVDLLSPKGHREIIVWVWYPASPAEDAKKAEWLPGIWGEVYGAMIAPRPQGVVQRPAPGLPWPGAYPMNTIQAHSYTDAHVASAQQKYPVLVFAPGYGAFPTEYSGLIEDVVSHGYIVAGIVPTYFSRYTVFSDRVVGQIQDWRDVPGAPRLSADRGLVSEAVYRLWTGDLRFTLNQLERLNADTKSPLKGRFDFDRVGVFGHSMGATATAQVAKDDPRFRAATLLDGVLMGDVAENPNVPKPMLHIRSGISKGERLMPGEMRSPVLRNAKPGYSVMIRETTHSFATDTGLMPYAMASMRDPNRARTIAVTRAYIIAFFDQHLLGKTSALLNGPAPDYPEVSFENTLEKR